MKELFDIDRTTPDINIDRMIRTLKGSETGKNIQYVCYIFGINDPHYCIVKEKGNTYYLLHG